MNDRRHSVLFRWAALTGIALLTLIPVSRSFAEPDLQPLPAVSSYVTDTTGTLSQTEKDDLSAILERIETENGSQVVLVVIPTTQPEAVEQYSIRLASQVGIGRKGTDDGVLILIAKDDRRIRIEVGYGLEGAIPDARANRIIEQTIVPELKKGRFYPGLRSGVLEIEGLIKKEELPPPAEPAPDQKVAEESGFEWMSLFYRAWYYWGWLAYVIGFVVAWIAGKRSEYSWGMLWTVAVAAHPPLLFFLLNGVFFPIYALPRILISLVLFHIAYWLSGGKFPKMASGTSSASGYSSSGRSWSSGSSSRSYSSSRSSYSSSSSRSTSSSSSSSSSSRSYSGGGGSFGGGGASGSW